MVYFDPDNNCIEAFDVSGHVDVYIDGALHSRCKFTEAVKVHLVFNSLKDTGISDSIDRDKINHSVANDCLPADDSKRHVSSECLGSLCSQNQAARSPNVNVPPVDISNADESCFRDSHISEVKDRHQVSGAVNEGDCEDTKAVLESSIESGNEDESSQSDITSEIEKNSGRRSSKRVSVGSKRPRKAISGSNELSCPTCGKCFSNKEQLFDHRRNPSCRVYCSECQERFPSKVTYFIHFCKYHPNCDIKAEFREYINLTRPVVWCADKEVVKCPLCLKSLKEGSILNHLECSHFREPSYACCVCEETFYTERLWRLHSRSHVWDRHLAPSAKSSAATTTTATTTTASTAGTDVSHALGLPSLKKEVHDSGDELTVTFQNDHNNQFRSNDETVTSSSHRSTQLSSVFPNTHPDPLTMSIQQQGNVSDSCPAFVKGENPVSSQSDQEVQNNCSTLSSGKKNVSRLSDVSNFADDTNASLQGSGKSVTSTSVSRRDLKSSKGKRGTSYYSCEFCAKPFFCKRAKNAHRLNPSCEVKCISCSTIHSSKGSLFEHYCRVHPTVQDLREQFGSSFSFVNLKVFKDQGICPVCMAPLSDRGCVKHFDTIHFVNQLYLCCVCGKDFSTEQLWFDHCTTEHGNGKQDAVTNPDNSFSQRKNVAREGKKRKVTPRKRVKLSVTSERAQQTAAKKLNEVISAEADDGGEHQCKYCKETFTSKAQLLTHPRRKLEVKSVCKHCGKICRDQAALIVHEKKKHGGGLVFDTSSGPKGVKMFECPVCLEKVRHIIMHVRKKHTNESLFVCCVCGKSCQSFAEYTRHCDALHTHRQKGIYHCSMCNKICDNMSDFNSHKAIHRKICSFCGEKFLLQKHLQLHYSEKHDEKLIPCGHCDRKFPSMNALRTHEKYMKFRPLRPCPKCGLMLRGVKRHMKAMHPDVQAEAQCNICGKTVKNEKRLAVHMLCHKNDQLACSVCFKVFKHSQALTRHLKIVHFVEKLFECNICGKRCSMKSNLRIHMRIHSDDKMFPCTFCSQGFNYKASLLSHMRSKHPDMEPVGEV
ncbi:zinc finger protein 888 [Aplysia californica]|uniref:Zinc finger protein 888 n=1 Tax=Aplysia californica TaxID=6500 RepID=A0ABM0ZUF0_APLCA|nr:zinc finger protein 888 [Aplysia californica]XP_012934687.1 zinc finger protein 888 [Aplysia californica]